MLHGDFVIWDHYRTGRYFDEFVRRVDPACCKLQLDLGATLQMGGDPREVVRSHGAHLGSVHLRDGKPPFDPKTYPRYLTRPFDLAWRRVFVAFRR